MTSASITILNNITTVIFYHHLTTYTVRYWIVRSCMIGHLLFDTPCNYSAWLTRRYLIGCNTSGWHITNLHKIFLSIDLLFLPMICFTSGLFIDPLPVTTFDMLCDLLLWSVSYTLRIPGSSVVLGLSDIRISLQPASALVQNSKPSQWCSLVRPKWLKCGCKWGEITVFRQFFVYNFFYKKNLKNREPLFCSQ